MKLLSGRIPVYINPFFLVMVALIGWMYTQNIIGMLIFALIIFVSVLVHEFGHALTAVAFGQTAYIELWGLGGLTHRRGGKIPLWKDFIIVMNGPLAGLFLGVLALFFLKITGDGASTLLNQMLRITVYVNFFWTFVNLLPILPMDGGHLMRIIMEGIFGFKGVKIAFFVSFILAALIAGLSAMSRQIFLLILFSLFAFESFRSWQSLRNVADHDRDDSLQLLLQEAERDFQSGNIESAINTLEQVRKKTKHGMIYVQASEIMSEILMNRGETETAHALLSNHFKQLSLPALHLLQKASFKLGKFQEAIEAGTRIHQVEQDPEVALVNALAHARLHEEKPAVGWLKSAIRSGLQNPREALMRRDFDSIRNSPEFQKVLLGNSDK